MGLLFPSRVGTVRNPNNFGRTWRAARGATFAWITPRTLVQVVEQDLPASAVAEFLDFTEQLSCVGAALIPSLMQVGLELIEQTRAATGAVVDQ